MCIDESMFGISYIESPYDMNMFVLFRDFKNKDVLDCIKITQEEWVDGKKTKINKFINEIKEISGIWEVQKDG